VSSWSGGLGRLIILKIDMTTCTPLEQRLYCMKDNLDVLSMYLPLLINKIFTFCSFILLPVFLLEFWKNPEWAGLGWPEAKESS